VHETSDAIELPRHRGRCHVGVQIADLEAASDPDDDAAAAAVDGDVVAGLEVRGRPLGLQNVLGGQSRHRQQRLVVGLH
jgi:hypothetical protein